MPRSRSGRQCVHGLVRVTACIQLLSHHDSPAVVGETAATRVPSEHRLLCTLGLREEPFLPAVGLQEQDPGRGPVTAPHHLHDLELA